ncbi:helix-turn-helix transcriptional regulator [Acinetobacter baumannii]
MVTRTKHACIICEYLLKNNLVTDVEYEKICGSVCFEFNPNIEFNKAVAKNIITYCEKFNENNIALNAGNIDLSKFKILEIGTLIQENYLQAILFAFRHQTYTFPFAKIDIHFERNISFIIEPILFSDPNEKGYIFSVEYHLSQIYQFLKTLLPSIDKPKKINLKFANASKNKFYENFFNCEINFNKDFNQIFFDINRTTLIKKLEPLNYSEIQNKIIDFLNFPVHSNRANSELKNKIYYILNQSNNNFPDEFTIASQLNMHPRTLRRKLKLENESFRKIVADFKMRKAINLLITTEQNYKQIAFQLGFKTSTSFSKAFKIWTGHTPQYYRLLAKE